MPTVSATTIPAASLLRGLSEGADFKDAYDAPLADASLSPTQIFLAAARAAPAWAEALMSMRNRVVRLFGLKDVGALGAMARTGPQDYEVGDRLGIFNVFAKTSDEIVLGIDDRHVDVRVSVMKTLGGESPRYAVSTVVNVHNLLGRLYMLPVARIHPLIVRSMMGRAAT